MARRLRKAYVPWNHRAKYLVAEKLDQLPGHVARQAVARIIHGSQNALYVEVRVAACAHPFHCFDQSGQPFKGVVLALHRDQHAIRRDQCIHGEHIQGRRTIDDQIVVLRRKRFEQFAKPDVAPLHLQQLDLGCGQIDVRRQQIKSGRSRGTDLRRAALAQQPIVGAQVQFILIDAAAHGGIALGIQVDQQHTGSGQRQRRAQVDAGGGLTHPAFLVGDCDDPAQ